MDHQSLTIVKLGGKLIDQERLFRESLSSFSGLEGPKILVHGGGASATRLADRMGVIATMVDGRRITDKSMLEIAVMVYGGKINKQIVGQLQALGVNALGLTGADLNLIQAHKRPVTHIDYGFVGDIDEINLPMLIQLLDLSITPVFAPITHDLKGQLLNTNADTIASTLARALSSQYEVNLVFCFDKPGVLRDPAEEISLIKEISTENFEQLKSQHIITEGMIPKLDNAFDAIRAGVKNVFLCSPSQIQNIRLDTFSGTRLFT